MQTVPSLRLALWLSLGLASCTGGSKDTTTSTSDSGSPPTTTTPVPTPVPTTTPMPTTTPLPVGCNNPEPLSQGGALSGYERCDDGLVHRVSAIDAIIAKGATGTCDKEKWCTEDCSALANGFCNEVKSDADDVCFCNDACTTDSDCNNGEVCYPNGVASTCIPATCVTTDDCAGDALCVLVTEYDICGNPSWEQACQTPDDTCRTDEDCRTTNSYGTVYADACTFDGTRYACSYVYSGDCGRPFTVDGAARVAPLAARSDWTAPAVAPKAMAQVAAYWARIGQLEHASIASFSRFSMELLHLGAPPDLLAEAYQAGLDEIRHAQLCFGLASAFGERDVGPEPLDVGGAFAGGLDRVSVMRRLIHEACVGETLAALEAAEAARRATCPAVREALEEIAADEQRHATLGWRCLRWMLSEGDAGLREEALRTLQEAVASAGEPGTNGEQDDLEAYGVLDPATRAELLEQGKAEVILPLAATLMAPVAQAAATTVRA